jgi:hypothetical protein
MANESESGRKSRKSRRTERLSNPNVEDTRSGYIVSGGAGGASEGGATVYRIPNT